MYYNLIPILLIMGNDYELHACRNVWSVWLLPKGLKAKAFEKRSKEIHPFCISIQIPKLRRPDVSIYCSRRNAALETSNIWKERLWDCGLWAAFGIPGQFLRPLPAALGPRLSGRVVVLVRVSQTRFLSLPGIFQTRAACRGRKRCDLGRLNAVGWKSGL